MVNGLVKQYVESMKASWSQLLANHGYSQIEEDLTSDGQWHGQYPDESRDLGKVAFWKRNNLDGVVVNAVKFYSDDGHTAHGTGVGLVGSAYDYFKSIGYEAGIQRSRTGFMRVLENCGLVKKTNPILRRDVTTLNNRGVNAVDTRSSVDFYNFLKQNTAL